MLNRSTLDNYTSSLPAKRSFSSSALFFGGGFLFLILAAGIYSILEFRTAIFKSEKAIATYRQQDSILVVSKDVLVKLFVVYEAGLTSPMQKDSLQAEFDRYRAALSFIKVKYLNLFDYQQDILGNDLLLKVKKYFIQSDTIIYEMARSGPFNINEQGETASANSFSIRTALLTLINEDFQILQLISYKRTSEQASIRYHLVRSHSIRSIVLFAALVLFAIILTILLVRLIYNNIYGQRRFHALLDYLNIPVQMVDCEGVTSYINPPFEQWSGMDRSSVIGKDIFDRLKVSNQKEPAQSLWPFVQPALTSGQVWTGDVEFTRPDGKIALSHIVLSPVFNKRGSLKECIALHHDLTERKEFARKIIETQQQYRSIVESSLDGIVIIQKGILVYANPSAVRLFGYPKMEEMQKLNIVDIIATPNRSFLEIEQDGHAVGDEVLRNYEMRGLTKQKKMIDLEVNAHIIEWNDSLGIQASFRDITKRKMLEREQSLWLWEQETLSNIDRQLVGVLDLDNIFSAILQQTLNLTRAHFAGVLLLEESQDNVQWKAIRGNTLQHTLEVFKPHEQLKVMLKNEAPDIIHNSDDSSSHWASQIPVIGEEKLVSIAWMPLLVEGKLRGMLVVGYRHYHEFVGREMRLLISLAEKHSIAMVNAQLYTDLLKREKELEILSSARVQAQEDERRRIAREIHDGLGQMLTAIKFNLEILEDMIPAAKEERDRINDMKELLDSVMKEAREISYNLMPSVLDDFGLAPALQLLAEQFTNRTEIKVQFHAHGLTERLDPQMEIGLYRIVQESFNNVAKHSEATEISLQLIRSAGGVRLVIEDNGKGTDLKSSNVRATGKGGMGLVSMRERASSFGGVFTIDSAPKSGTLVTVEIPLAKSNDHD